MISPNPNAVYGSFYFKIGKDRKLEGGYLEHNELVEYAEECIRNDNTADDLWVGNYNTVWNEDQNRTRYSGNLRIQRSIGTVNIFDFAWTNITLRDEAELRPVRYDGRGLLRGDIIIGCYWKS